MFARGAAAAALIFSFACNPIAERQRAVASSLTPELRPDGPVHAVRVGRKVTIRAYVDEHYQREQSTWSGEIARTVEAASQLLEEQLGVAIAIESIKPWPRNESKDDIQSTLEALVALDPGEGVHFVVGFTGNLPVFTDLVHELGFANICAKHFVLRGMNNVVEYDALTQILDKLSVDEQERVYRRRVLHKASSVFLHELGHALGAIHSSADDDVMYFEYSPRIRGLSRDSAGLIEVGLAHHTDGRPDEWLAARRKYLESNEHGRWDPDERKRALNTSLEHEAVVKRAAGDKALQEKLDRAVALIENKNYQGAKEALADMGADDHPDPRVASVRCLIGAYHEPLIAESRVWCDRAIERAAHVVPPRLWRASLLEKNEAHADALKDVIEVQRVLETAKDTAATSWPFVAEAYERLAALTFAERAAERCPVDQRCAAVIERVRSIRRENSLPVEGLTPEREGDYLRLRWKAGELLRDKTFAEAARIAETLKTEFPAAPGHAEVTCRLLYGKKQLDKAWTFCSQAERKYRGAAEFPYVLGLVEVARGYWAFAVAPLKRALAIDPAHLGARSLLEQAYRQTKQFSELEMLRGRK
jgi:hypothetical protein